MNSLHVGEDSTFHFKIPVARIRPPFHQWMEVVRDWQEGTIDTLCANEIKLWKQELAICLSIRDLVDLVVTYLNRNLNQLLSLAPSEWEKFVDREMSNSRFALIPIGQ